MVRLTDRPDMTLDVYRGCKTTTRMTTLTFILSKLFPLDFFRCNFLSAPLLEYPLGFYHDTSQLCRTHLSSLYFLSYLPLMIKATMPSILNTIRTIFIRLYGSVEEVMPMCLE